MRDEILREHSKKQAVMISDHVGNDTGRFEILVELCFDNDIKVVQRATWILSHCTDNFPELIVPYLDRFIVYAANDPPHVAVKRNVVRIMKTCPIPQEIEGVAYDMCWNFANSAKEDIAVRAFALRVMHRIAGKYPDLREEVFSVAEGFSQSESKGLLSCGRDIVNRLKKLY